MRIMAVGTPACLLGVAALSGATLEGWVLLNNSILGLLAPTILPQQSGSGAGRRFADSWSHASIGAGAVLSGLVYCLVQITVLLSPARKGLATSFRQTRTRLYGYSLTIIAYGTALLVAGFRMAHRDLRIAALAVVGLGGSQGLSAGSQGLGRLWRATSFIGLGISLIGIAYLYRWLEPEGETSLKADVRHQF